MKYEVVTFKAGEWRLFVGDNLHPATWLSKGAAEIHGKRCVKAGKMLP